MNAKYLLLCSYLLVLFSCAPKPDPWPYTFPRGSEPQPSVEERLLREQQETNRLLRELQREQR